MTSSSLKLIVVVVGVIGLQRMRTTLNIVNAAATTLIWTIATSFFFVNLIFLYRQNRVEFLNQRQFPMPVIWLSVVIGGIACIMTIIAILVYPWIPQVSSNQWWIIVGGFGLALLIIAGVASMVASGEAGWEDMGKG